MVVTLNKIGPCKYEIPLDKSKGMRVPGIVFSNENLAKDLGSDQALDQVINVAGLQGIVGASIAMPEPPRTSMNHDSHLSL